MKGALDCGAFYEEEEGGEGEEGEEEEEEESFRSHYVPGVDSASNRNEYQEYTLGVKAAGA